MCLPPTSRSRAAKDVSDHGGAATALVGVLPGEANDVGALGHDGVGTVAVAEERARSRVDGGTIRLSDEWSTTSLHPGHVSIADDPPGTVVIPVWSSSGATPPSTQSSRTQVSSGDCARPSAIRHQVRLSHIRDVRRRCSAPVQGPRIARGLCSGRSRARTPRNCVRAEEPDRRGSVPDRSSEAHPRSPGDAGARPRSGERCPAPDAVRCPSEAGCRCIGQTDPRRRSRGRGWLNSARARRAAHRTGALRPRDSSTGARQPARHRPRSHPATVAGTGHDEPWCGRRPCSGRPPGPGPG